MKTIKLGPTTSLRYHPQWISAQQSAAWLKQWTTELNWEQSEITIFGKKTPIPRLNAWYGDLPYQYSGKRFEAQAWPPELLKLKSRLQASCGLAFNSVLINLYRDGSDSMGWHSDDEKSLGNNPQIASISLGDSRRFLLREKSNHANKYEIELGSGSLLLMLGETQKLWQHAVPRTARIKAPRMNLTFRLIKDSE